MSRNSVCPEKRRFTGGPAGQACTAHKEHGHSDGVLKRGPGHPSFLFGLFDTRLSPAQLWGCRQRGRPCWGAAPGSPAGGAQGTVTPGWRRETHPAPCSWAAGAQAAQVRSRLRHGPPQWLLAKQNPCFHSDSGCLLDSYLSAVKCRTSKFYLPWIGLL